MTNFIYIFFQSLIVTSESTARKTRLLFHFRNLYRIKLHELIYPADSFPSSLSIIKAFKQLDDLWIKNPHHKFRFIGDSVGALYCATYAARHPERVDKQFLIYPFFDAPELVNIVNRAARDRTKIWLKRKFLDLSIPSEVSQHSYLYWIEEKDLPKLPLYKCKTFIMYDTGYHGTGIVKYGIFLKKNRKQKAVTSIYFIDDEFFDISSVISQALVNLHEFFELSGKLFRDKGEIPTILVP